MDEQTDKLTDNISKMVSLGIALSLGKLIISEVNKLLIIRLKTITKIKLCWYILRSKGFSLDITLKEMLEDIGVEIG